MAARSSPDLGGSSVGFGLFVFQLLEVLEVFDVRFASALLTASAHAGIAVAGFPARPEIIRLGHDIVRVAARATHY
jgi:hypothetical protein